MTNNYNLRSLSQRTLKIKNENENENDKINRFFDTYDEYIEKQNSRIEIKLKLLNGKKYDFIVNKNITLKKLYTKIEYLTNIDCITFYFVKNHQRFPKFEEIQDWMTLSDFNFKLNEINALHLILRLGGPMEPFRYIKEHWFK